MKAKYVHLDLFYVWGGGELKAILFRTITVLSAGHGGIGHTDRVNVGDFESGEANRLHIPPAPLPRGGGGDDFKINLKKEKKRSEEKEGKGKTKRQSDKKRIGMVGKTREIESKKGDFAVMILEAFFKSGIGRISKSMLHYSTLYNE